MNWVLIEVVTQKGVGGGEKRKEDVLYLRQTQIFKEHTNN